MTNHALTDFADVDDLQETSVQECEQAEYRFNHAADDRTVALEALAHVVNYGRRDQRTAQRLGEKYQVPGTSGKLASAIASATLLQAFGLAATAIKDGR